MPWRNGFELVGAVMSESNYIPSKEGYKPPLGYERMDKVPEERRTILFITDHQEPQTIVGQYRNSGVLLIGCAGIFGWYNCGRVYAGWKYLIDDIQITMPTEQPIENPPSESDCLISEMLELLKEAQAYFGVGEITKTETEEVSVHYLAKLARTIAKAESEQ